MAATMTVAADRQTSQRWAYALILAASGVAHGVSGVPAPLCGTYQKQWHFTPLTTTLGSENARGAGIADPAR